MSNQTISTTVSGPIVSNGGAITVTSSGKILGKTNGRDGVVAVSASITTLSNSGAIDGGFGGPRIAGGVGVWDAAGEINRNALQLRRRRDLLGESENVDSL